MTARSQRAALVLAAGADKDSRALLHEPLGDLTVAGLALANVRAVVDPERIVVVVSAGDTAIRDELGADLTYVEQPEPLGTGNAASLALGSVGGDVQQVLVTYADTPLLRPESLLGIFTRHQLKGADLSILTAVVDNPTPGLGRVIRDAGRIVGDRGGRRQHRGAAGDP